MFIKIISYKLVYMTFIDKAVLSQVRDGRVVASEIYINGNTNEQLKFLPINKYKQRMTYL